MKKVNKPQNNLVKNLKDHINLMINLRMIMAKEKLIMIKNVIMA